MKARVHVTLKPGVLDPSGFEGVTAVRQGKVFEIEMADTDAASAEAQIDEMCRKLLANTVIENYDISIEG